MGDLTVELIPKTCFYSNVRTLLPKKYWDLLRRASYAKAEYKCEICGESGKDQGYKHEVECHEIWDYDDKLKVQILTGLISLCPKCHQVKHFGRTSAIGLQAHAFKRMERINDWTHKQCVTHLAESMIEWSERSIYKWRLDISVLNELVDIPEKLIAEAVKKRK